MKSNDVDRALAADTHKGSSSDLFWGCAMLVIGDMTVSLHGIGFGRLIAGTILLAKSCHLFQLTVIQQYHVDADVHQVDDGESWKNGSIDDDDFDDGN